MGFPSGGVGTQYYNSSSIVEDVTDMIFQITPEDTPLWEMSGETTAVAVTHEWQIRDLNTRQHNAQAEGFTYSFTTSNTLPSRRSNVSQVLAKEIRVSNTHQAVSHYAISDLYADQMQLSMTEWKTDAEHTLWQGSFASGDATANERQMAGLLYALETAATSTFTDYGGGVQITESNVNEQLQACWEAGAEPRDTVVGAKFKREISGFNAGGQRYVPHDSGKVVNTISFYQSDFFPIQVHLARDIPSYGSTNDIVHLDRTMLKKAFLRPVVAKVVPETADSVDGVIVGEFTLEWGNPNAHFYGKDMDIT